MSLQHAAQHLAAHGRGPDTTLVHMSSDEVKSLNELAMAHGGHLTTNPHTGLPEAGFLSSILPMIAGVGLTAVSGGALSPLAAGLLVGGGTGLMTGDLKEGLLAGLGAYGGAGLGSALAQSGMQAAASASPEALAAQQNALSNATALGNSAPNMVPYSPTGFAEAANATTAPIDVARQSALESAQTQFASPATSFTDRLSTMGQGVKSLGSSGGIGGFYENLGNVGETFGPKTTLAAAAAPIAAEDMTRTETPVETDKDMGQQYTYNSGTVLPTPASDASGREQIYFKPSYTPVSASAAKGIYGYAEGGSMWEQITGGKQGQHSGQQPEAPTGYSYDASAQQYTKMAAGGIPDAQYNLGGYSDGGRLLRGPGDGVSDSIPAVIGHKQPARLADGEFVVPARIVSELGNGSTEAGARKLYAMMDRIQKARSSTVGEGKIAKNSQAEKYLPA